MFGARRFGKSGSFKDVATAGQCLVGFSKTYHCSLKTVHSVQVRRLLEHDIIQRAQDRLGQAARKRRHVFIGRQILSQRYETGIKSVEYAKEIGSAFATLCLT